MAQNLVCDWRGWWCFTDDDGERVSPEWRTEQEAWEWLNGLAD